VIATDLGHRSLWENVKPQSDLCHHLLAQVGQLLTAERNSSKEECYRKKKSNRILLETTLTLYMTH
jgi:hypothetical protein